MSVVALKLHSEDNEVHQVDTNVEVSVPAFTSEGAIYEGCIGFT